MTETIRVVAMLNVEQGRGAELLSLWPALAGKVRAEEGCLAYDLHAVAGSDAKFVVLERWTSRATLRAHGTSLHMQEFGSLASDLLAARPDVTVIEDVPRF